MSAAVEGLFAQRACVSVVVASLFCWFDTRRALHFDHEFPVTRRRATPSAFLCDCLRRMENSRTTGAAGGDGKESSGSQRNCDSGRKCMREKRIVVQSYDVTGSARSASHPASLSKKQRRSEERSSDAGEAKNDASENEGNGGGNDEDEPSRTGASVFMPAGATPLCNRFLEA